MKHASLIVTVSAMLLWAVTALAVQTPQQYCDAARITAWKVYQACVEGVVARDAKGIVFDEFAAFARCRHTYFKTWSRFQAKASLAGSTCIGTRFTDNGNQTVTDNLSGLVWEKKNTIPGDVRYVNNTYYSWSTNGSDEESGTVFTDFLTTLNTAGFASANG